MKTLGLGATQDRARSPTGAGGRAGFQNTRGGGTTDGTASLSGPSPGSRTCELSLWLGRSWVLKGKSILSQTPEGSRGTPLSLNSTTEKTLTLEPDRAGLRSQCGYIGAADFGFSDPVSSPVKWG